MGPGQSLRRRNDPLEADRGGPRMNEPHPHETRIRASVDRIHAALERMDSFGRGTASTRARVRQGLTCQVEDGAWSFTADMPSKAGGSAEGPDPGVFGRASLASCLAIGYSLWAAHAGVPITELEVEVQADYDTRAQFGIGDDSPAYRAIRWIVNVQSPAPEAEVREVLDLAEARSPYLALFREPQELRRKVRIRKAGPDRTPSSHPDARER
ncbi:MAG: OsmC family peroxiredoxin [Gemmatimonadales bacterium]|nr:MAG: OsmC family peroxiredoxin [Gemmatimonadales bacterium]